MPETQPQKITDPTDIERAIEAYLAARVEEFKKTARLKDRRYIFTDPAMTVAVYDGRLERVGQEKFRVHCPVHVELIVSHAGGETPRRDKINPLVFAVIRTLSRQRFNLAITDLLPGTFRDVTTEEDYKNIRIVYDIQFATSFILAPLQDEEETDLLGIAFQYFLQPGDDSADVEDETPITQEAP